MAWKQTHSTMAGRGKVGKQLALLAVVSIHSSVSFKHQILQPLVCHFVQWNQCGSSWPLEYLFDVKQILTREEEKVRAWHKHFRHMECDQSLPASTPMIMRPRMSISKDPASKDRDINNAAATANTLLSTNVHFLKGKDGLGRKQHHGR